MSCHWSRPSSSRCCLMRFDWYSDHVSTASDLACNIACTMLSSFTFVTAMNAATMATITATVLFSLFCAPLFMSAEFSIPSAMTALVNFDIYNHPSLAAQPDIISRLDYLQRLSNLRH